MRFQYSEKREYEVIHVVYGEALFCMLVRIIMVTQSKDSFVLALWHIAPLLFSLICTRYTKISSSSFTLILYFTVYALSVGVID